MIDASPGETITVPDGTYVLATEIAIEKRLTINGQSSAGTVLSGGGETRIFAIKGAGNEVTITDLTLRDGRAAPPAEPRGGAIIVSEAASLTLQRVIATGNVADASGGPGANGGIAEGGAVAASSANLAIYDSALTGNTANASGGSGKSGGIAQGGGVFTVGGTDLRKVVATTASSNRADVSGGPGASGGIAQGGGIFSVSGGETTQLTASTIALNTGVSAGIVQGGGLFTLGKTESRSSAAPSPATTAAPVPKAATSSPWAAGPWLTRSSPPGSARRGSPTATPPGNRPASTSRAPTSAASKPPATASTPIRSWGRCRTTADRGRRWNRCSAGRRSTRGAPSGWAPTSAGCRGRSTSRPSPTRPSRAPTAPTSVPSSCRPRSTSASAGCSATRRRGSPGSRSRFPSPTFGTVVLYGKGLKKKKKTIDSATQTSFYIVTKGGIKKQLLKRGKRKVRVKVRYVAAGNAPVLKAKTVKLVKKTKKKAKRNENHR